MSEPCKVCGALWLPCDHSSAIRARNDETPAFEQALLDYVAHTMYAQLQHPAGYSWKTLPDHLKDSYRAIATDTALRWSAAEPCSKCGVTHEGVCPPRGILTTVPPSAEGGR